VANPFTHVELEDLERRAMKLAQAEEDTGVRTALQVLGEAAANLRSKTPSDN
jgi:hypothetical protein